MRKSVFIAALLVVAMPLGARQNRMVVCEECRQMVQMTDSTISRMGYGNAPTQAEADSIAMKNARKELVKLLRDSVAAICNRATVGRNTNEEYLELQLFNPNDQPLRFVFTNKGILTDTPIVCLNRVQKGDNMFYSCCILASQREELSKDSILSC